MGWKLTYDGQSFVDGDASLDQIERMEAVAETRWLSSPLHSAKAARAYFSVVVADRLNISADEAAKRVGAMTEDEFLALFTVVDDDDLPTEFDDGFPPVAGAQETTGSSGSPATSSGLPMSSDDNGDVTST